MYITSQGVCTTMSSLSSPNNSVPVLRFLALLTGGEDVGECLRVSTSNIPTSSFTLISKEIAS